MPCKATRLQWESPIKPTRELSFHPVAMAGTVEVTKPFKYCDVKGPARGVSERAGRNMSEHRASLEKGNANADPVETGGRLLLQVKRATRAPCRFAGVMVTACWQQESWRNTGNPVRWGGSPQRLARESGSGSSRVAERPVVVRRRLIPAEPRGLSSRAMNKGKKAQRLT